MAIGTYRKSASYREKQKQWTKNWREKKMETDPEYAKKVRARSVNYMREHYKKRYPIDIQYRKRLSNYGRFHNIFQRIVRMKRNQPELMISCTLQEFIDHLEKQFTPKMSWNNYSEYWVIDHIDGIGMFDLTKKDQVLACWHYTNLRPMIRDAHLRKRNGLVLRY